ncbi:hypothetical protein RND81_02G226600 [Saponaria officinalis]|uniref:Tetratricopeptide repeat protein 38 n=1 Tax=Saponaria officinalis TaxID=3572 RepID=A0AAW1MSL3_SAPOF
MGIKEEVKLNKWGYQVKTSSDKCISAINEYYNQVLSYGRKRSIILEAQIHDENCVLANILAAHFLCSTNSSKVAIFLEAAKSNYDEATDYEKAVYDAVSYMMLDDRDDDVALSLHFKLLNDFPRDLASLKRAQVLCFYMGKPGPSLDLVQQVLPKNEGESYIYGMLAFPFLELDLMEDAERAARNALEINKLDFWAQHCLCHVLQFKCRFAEAVTFMEECSPSWVSCASFMYTHNWWHVALCYLEGHAPIERAVDIYDHCIMTELDKPDAARTEVFVNALGLLLRLQVRGEIHIFEDRLKTLAEHLTDQAVWFAEWMLDIFILWALASTGKLSTGQQLLDDLRSRVANMNEKKQRVMQRGLDLAEALYEYGMGNYENALQLFRADFDANDCKAIGASDEQLDVFNEVWYTLLLNTGQADKVIEVIERRLKKREGVPFLWRLLEKGYSMIGSDEATTAAEKANSLENSFFT